MRTTAPLLCLPARRSFTPSPEPSGVPSSDRARTTPVFADMVAAGTPTEPAETIMGTALGGLFAAFILSTGAALVAIGLTLTVIGVVAPPVGWLASLIAAFGAVGNPIVGDMLPADLYRRPCSLASPSCSAGHECMAPVRASEREPPAPAG